MVVHSFQLLPFGGDLQHEGVSVGGTISRSCNILCLSYQLNWDGDPVVLPAQCTSPLRRNNLWQRTCFECFLKEEDGSGYYELNLSPDGCWNMYSFTTYRNGMAEEPGIVDLKSEVTRESRSCTLSCSLSLDGCIRPEQSIITGVSCVLEFSDGQKRYWALDHPGPQPDFHNPDSFLLKL